jgi:hypothetical protein
MDSKEPIWTKYAPGQERKTLTFVSHECTNGDCEKCKGLFPPEDSPYGEFVMCIHECHLAENHDSYIPIP